MANTNNIIEKNAFELFLGKDPQRSFGREDFMNSKDPVFLQLQGNMAVMDKTSFRTKSVLGLTKLPILIPCVHLSAHQEVCIHVCTLLPALSGQIEGEGCGGGVGRGGAREQSSWSCLLPNTWEIRSDKKKTMTVPYGLKVLIKNFVNLSEKYFLSYVSNFSC